MNRRNFLNAAALGTAANLTRGHSIPSGGTRTKIAAVAFDVGANNRLSLPPEELGAAGARVETGLDALPAFVAAH